MKKVLFIDSKYAPETGGTCTMFRLRFSQYPPDKIVVLTNRMAGSESFDRSVPYRIYRMPMGRGWPKRFPWFGQVLAMVRIGLALARENKCEAVESARPLPEGLAGYLIARILSLKCITNSHGEDLAMWRNYPVEKWLLAFILPRTDLHLANSRFTQGLLQSMGGPKTNSRVVHPGFSPWNQALDPEKLRRIREKVGGHPIVITVGRVEAKKGQDRVVQALPSLLQTFPDLKYLIVGAEKQAPDHSPIQRLAAALGVADHIHQWGLADDEDLPYLYAAADLFIMASREEGQGSQVEGFGIVFVEAASFGLPIIAGRSGGTEDAILEGENGYLIDGRSESEITSAVVKILADGNLKEKMSLASRAFAERLNYRKMFASYAEILRGLAG